MKRVRANSKREIAWGVIAQFWADTSYDDAELERFAAELAGCDFSLAELDRIAHWEVGGAFAVETLIIFATAGLGAPDFCYPEVAARRQVATWLARPRILSLCNPLWLLGYLLARGLLRWNWPDLRARVAKRLAKRDSLNSMGHLSGPNKTLEPTA